MATYRRFDAANRVLHGFLMLSFLGLSVLPQLRITDRGLVDVDRFELTSLAAGD